METIQITLFSLFFFNKYINQIWNKSSPSLSVAWHNGACLECTDLTQDDMTSIKWNRSGQIHSATFSVCFPLHDELAKQCSFVLPSILKTLPAQVRCISSFSEKYQMDKSLWRIGWGEWPLPKTHTECQQQLKTTNINKTYPQWRYLKAVECIIFTNELKVTLAKIKVLPRQSGHSEVDKIYDKTFNVKSSVSFIKCQRSCMVAPECCIQKTRNNENYYCNTLRLLGKCLSSTNKQ